MSTQAVSSPVETAPRTTAHVASIVAASALVISGLALVVGELVLSSNAIPEGAAGLAAIEANMPAYRLSHWISFVFTIFIPLGLIGVAAVAYQRRAWAAYIGAILAIIGNLFHSAVFVYEAIILPAMARLPDQQSAMVALLDQVNNDSSIFAVFVLALVFNLGLLIMAIGLWRKGLIPIWAAGLGVAAIILEFGFAGQHVVHLVALALFAVFLSAVGVALIRHAKPEVASS